MHGTPKSHSRHTAVPLHTVWENLHIKETTIQCTHDLGSLLHMAQSKTLNYNRKPSSGNTVGGKQFHPSWPATPVRVRTYTTFLWRANIWKRGLLCTNSSYHVIQQYSSVWAFVPEKKWLQIECRFGYSVSLN